jgi:predicted HAD superfamily Cof-like phosphohydrolase
MVYNPMKDLAEFHDKFDRDGEARRDRALSIPLINKRITLIEEEFDEVVEALLYIRTVMAKTFKEKNFDPKSAPAGWADLAKELADLLYVVYGTAEELGIPLQEVFAAVHESNMSKVWSDGTVHYNEIGKVLKPDTYSPPELGHLFDERNF